MGEPFESHGCHVTTAEVSCRNYLLHTDAASSLGSQISELERVSDMCERAVLAGRLGHPLAFLYCAGSRSPHGMSDGNFGGHDMAPIN